MATVEVNYVELRKYLRRLVDNGSKTAKKSVKNYVDQMAFKTQKESFKTMNKAFSYKNSSTKKYAEKFVRYKKAKLNKDPNKITSEIGAIGDVDGKSFKERKGGYLAKQETGGKIKQIKAKGKGLRSGLLLRNPRNIKGKSYKRITSKVNVRHFANKKHALGEAIRRARAKNKRYVVSPEYGVYRVTKRKAQKIYAFGNYGKIKVSKNKWLEPASNNIVSRRVQIWNDSFDYFRKKIQKKT